MRRAAAWYTKLGVSEEQVARVEEQVGEQVARVREALELEPGEPS